MAFLAWRMFLPDKSGQAANAAPNLKLALILAVPISVAAGMLGVGPSLLLLPTLILPHYEPKHAAAINALAVTPPSLPALLPHLATARVDPTLAAIPIVVGAAGSCLGARLTSPYVPGRRLKQGFGVLIVVITAYELYQILTHRGAQAMFERCIVATAKAQGAHLIALGSQGLGFVPELFLGSVSHQVIRHASAPVLLVPAARRG